MPSNVAKKKTVAKSATKSAQPTSPINSSPRMRKFTHEAPHLGNEMSTIFVGRGLTDQEPTKFMAHKALLTIASGFFAKCSSSGFAEAHSGVVELAGDEPDLFATFIHWVYTDRLFSKTKASTSEDDGEWRTLPHLYTLGERLDALKFTDAAVSGIIDKVTETGMFPVDWADHVYNNTIVTACPLRRLIVNFHVFAHRRRFLKKNASSDTENACPEFLEDAMHRIIDLGKGLYEQGDYSWILDPCDYHEHSDLSYQQE